jgi:hypothetical protein
LAAIPDRPIACSIVPPAASNRSCGTAVTKVLVICTCEKPDQPPQLDERDSLIPGQVDY